MRYILKNETNPSIFNIPNKKQYHRYNMKHNLTCGEIHTK